MPRIGKRNNSEEWLYLVDVLYMVDFESPMCARGFLTGDDYEELKILADQWCELKMKQIMDFYPSVPYCYPPVRRARKVKEFHTLPDLEDVTDIRSFLDSCHQDEVTVSFGPGLGAFVEQMEKAYGSFELE